MLRDRARNRSRRWPIECATYVADTANHTIRKVAPDGTVSTLAGSAGRPGSADGTGAAARFNAPGDLVVDAAGNVYVTDTGNSTLRKITPAGVTTTLAGAAGVIGITPGSTPHFSHPQQLTLVGDSLFITDSNGVLVLRHGAR